MAVILRNIKYNYLSTIWFIVLNFVSIPIIIKKMGGDAYGVLVIVGVVSGYFALLELGFGAALIKYIAEYHAVGDVDTINRICNTSLTVFGLFGIAGGLIMFFSAELIVERFLKIPEALTLDVITAFKISALGFFINMIYTPFGAIPDALQRMDLTNKRNIFFGTINTLGIIILLCLGKGIIAIVILGIVLNVIGMIVFYHISRRLLGNVSFYPKFDRPIFTMLFKFSSLRFISIINERIVYHLDKFLIAYFLPIKYLAYYSIALQLTQRVSALVSNGILKGLYPAVSHSLRINGLKEIRSYYIRTVKTILFFLLPILTVIIIYPHQILTFWIDENFADNGYIVLRLLAIAFLMISCANTPGSFTEAMGRPDVNAKFSIIASLSNIFFFMLFIPKFGINGAGLALIAGVLVQQPFFMIYVNRHVIQISNLSFVKECYMRSIICISIVTVFFYIFTFTPAGLLTFLMVISVGCLIYFASALYLKVFSIDERTLAKNYLMKYIPFFHGKN